MPTCVALNVPSNAPLWPGCKSSLSQMVGGLASILCQATHRNHTPKDVGHAGAPGKQATNHQLSTTCRSGILSHAKRELRVYLAIQL